MMKKVILLLLLLVQTLCFAEGAHEIKVSELLWSQSQKVTSLEDVIANVVEFATIIAWWLAITGIILWWYKVMTWKKKEEWIKAITNSLIGIWVIMWAYIIVRVAIAFFNSLL